ncbi:MAG: hypothetical protein ACRDPJ_08615 [Nocardioidaceae bacterium]
MTKTNSIFDQVRAHRPTDDPDWSHSPQGRRVMARALSMTPAVVPSRKAQHRLLVGTIATAGLTVVGGAAAAVMVLQADSPTQAGCYSSLSASADTTEASADLVAELGAVKACQLTWATLGESVDTRNPVSCINPAGGRGVFPAPAGAVASTACAQIGWQPENG